MASMRNEWHHRKVAEGQGRACWVCFKPSTSVLNHADNKDFFYICPGHLKDRGFAIADADEAAAAEEKKKKEELDREIDKVKKEYMERQDAKAKRRKERAKKKGKEKDDSKDDKKEDEEEDKKDEREHDEKIKKLEEKSPQKGAEDGPRIFSLHKNFYQMRLDRLKNIEQAKRNRERLKDPNTFPSVPKTEL